MERFQCWWSWTHKKQPGFRGWGVVFCLPGSMLILLLLCCCTTLALARPTQIMYAEYSSSNPAANALLAAAPTSVAVHFSARLDMQRSMLVVLDVNGKQVSSGSMHIDSTDPSTLMVDMQANQSEIYIVNWHTVTEEGNYHDGGSFRFFVHISPLLKNVLAQATAGAFAQPSSPAKQVTGAHAGAAAAPQPDKISVPLWIAGVIGLCGLAVGAGVMWSFSQQAEQRRAIALIVPIDDE
ncbi:copper resistance protein CopC [Dictyobacter kobayashii]|uniref:CopC domain-containing protein n=1 Tax=Dictyobacter kobayashii TaxID=2014872 RepID=A0A402AUW6_9CHLR|nr:copper resistance protein CopC [Dictyobacter kobayashii]GCE22902.1 hypothetical protein KDK_67020 [Dictyobacter kobayashii]